MKQIIHKNFINCKKILKNTAVKNNTYIFVGKNGTIWGPAKINEIVKDLKKVLKLKENLWVILQKLEHCR